MVSVDKRIIATFGVFVILALLIVAGVTAAAGPAPAGKTIGEYFKMINANIAGGGVVPPNAIDVTELVSGTNTDKLKQTLLKFSFTTNDLDATTLGSNDLEIENGTTGCFSLFVSGDTGVLGASTKDGKFTCGADSFGQVFMNECDWDSVNCGIDVKFYNGPEMHCKTIASESNPTKLGCSLESSKYPSFLVQGAGSGNRLFEVPYPNDVNWVVKFTFEADTDWGANDDADVKEITGRSSEGSIVFVSTGVIVK